MEGYAVAKQKFLDTYLEFRMLEDLTDIIQSYIIPHFEFFACDLGNLIIELQDLSKENKLEALEYIELIFNSQLYSSILESMKTSCLDYEFNFTHYMIILAENYKREKYSEIINNLDKMDQSDLKKSLLYDMVYEATKEKNNDCLTRMKNAYNDLKNYPLFVNCQAVCDNFFEENKITI
jgi:hypothetical protein